MVGWKNYRLKNVIICTADVYSDSSMKTYKVAMHSMPECKLLL
jgi:hypothetical protein